MKVASSDIISILRKFNVADESAILRQIERIATSHPSPINTLLSFRFQKKQWFILFDETADDRQDYILSQLRTHQNELQGELIENPLEQQELTYGLPYKGKDAYLFLVTSNKQRLDSLLAITHPDISRSTWQKYIKTGRVKVDGRIQTSPKLAVNQEVNLDIVYPEQTTTSNRKIPIIYQDENVIVINKPAGLLTHSKGALNDEFTVADFFRQFTTWGLESNRPGIVHRLDRDTSGVLIGALNEKTAHFLQKQFSNRKTKKTYYAVLEGVPKLTRAEIDIPIGRNPSAPSTFRANNKGKSAITRYEILSTKDNRSFVRLQPTTGRTHQLRVHMKYLGTPIVGDRVYGKPDDRLYLHATSLEITLPGGERITFQAPLPHEFQKYREILHE